MRLGISPCPNDTFVFHAWVHGLVDGPPVEVRYEDVDVLNSLVLGDSLDVVKVSYGVLPYLTDEWVRLRSGGALGHGCGPLVVSVDGSLREPVAIPGERTTAYLLLRLWLGRTPEVVVMPFDRILAAVRDGAVGSGLVIHESRFTYPSYGLRAVADLGEVWEGRTGLPVPLGAIVARRSLDVAAVDTAVRTSVEYAWAHPGASRAYVLEHAQEMEPAVVDAHIGLYVNEFTRDIGDLGEKAVRELLDARPV